MITDKFVVDINTHPQSFPNLHNSCANITSLVLSVAMDSDSAEWPAKAYIAEAIRSLPLTVTTLEIIVDLTCRSGGCSYPSHVAGGSWMALARVLHARSWSLSKVLLTLRLPCTPTEPVETWQNIMRGEFKGMRCSIVVDTVISTIVR